ncbi:MAG: hypothetical protein LBF41_06375 [Deltaproteobacteria bacterium]|nr:hypothetical protein [Deltaproteobacteria bacterium]
MIALFVLLASVPATGLRAFSQSSADTGQQNSKQSEREMLDINAIATLSVGIVIQSYGYIGIFADLYGKGVYDARQVKEMLDVTVQYLNNAQNILHKYQSRSVDVAPGDRRYIAEIEGILVILIREAENLLSFTQTRSEADLAKYNESRVQAHKLLEKFTSNLPSD